MIDRNKVEQAVRLLLEGMGEDPSREGLIDTPERVARMYEELYSGMDEHPGMYLEKTFRAENNDLIVEKDITFYSVCEHHLLPFYGKVHVAYVPDKKVAGLSKLARTVEVFSRRLQIQEHSPDSRRIDGRTGAPGRYGHDGGRAYVYDHAGNQKAGQPDCHGGKAGVLLPAGGPGKPVFPNGKGVIR